MGDAATLFTRGGRQPATKQTKKVNVRAIHLFFDTPAPRGRRLVHTHTHGGGAASRCDQTQTNGQQQRVPSPPSSSPRYSILEAAITAAEEVDISRAAIESGHRAVEALELKRELTEQIVAVQKNEPIVTQSAYTTLVNKLQRLVRQVHYITSHYMTVQLQRLVRQRVSRLASRARERERERDGDSGGVAHEERME